MILNNVGYNHHHDADFLIERPEGSGDNLLLIFKTDAILTLNGTEIQVPAKTFFLYPKGMPQYYRCVPKQTFTNDWIQFLFEDEEESWFHYKRIPYATPLSLKYTEFCSFCIKAISDENSSDHLHKNNSIQHYFWLMCNKVSEQVHENGMLTANTWHEMMLIIRNKIYSTPYLEWSIDWVSHETHMSRSAFQHHYKEQFGVTFVQDLIASRTAHAKMLLQTTNMPVYDVGMQCGYKNYEHFARQFKAQCGMSPGAFRKSAQQNAEEDT